MRKSFYILSLIAALWVVSSYFSHRRAPVEVRPEPAEADVLPTATSDPVSVPIPQALTLAKPNQLTESKPVPAVSMNVEGKIVSVPASTPHDAKTEALHKFVVEDGVAVIDGDVAIGEPAHSAREGTAVLPSVSLWPRREIPYFIQPSLENPARVKEAIEFFSSTAVQFVEYSGQEDVLVFQTGTGSCKSYVGRTGGKQPIWIAPLCGPHEIAHELMHAIGFTHEQNRSDRDRYIRLNAENIDPAKSINFEKMPAEFMQLSGLSEFSFDSIMLYPPTMFSRTGRPTMESLSPGQRIAPSEGLSEKDISRINKFYGAR